MSVRIEKKAKVWTVIHSRREARNAMDPQSADALTRAFLEFDQKAFKDGAIPGKTKELIALGIAQITQCPWCIDAHTKKAATAGASDAEIAETTFVAMAMAAGAAWSHGGLALQCLQEHKTAEHKG